MTLVVVLLIVGYLLNIYDVVVYFLSDSKLSDITALQAGKIIGIFVAPLGALLGYF